MELEDKIKLEILRNHQLNHFKSGESWYAGITNNIERRSKEHSVVKFLNDFRFIEASCQSAAAEIEKILHDKYRFVGGGKTNTIGNGSVDDSVFVYIYKISFWTKQ